MADVSSEQVAEEVAESVVGMPPVEQVAAVIFQPASDVSIEQAVEAVAEVVAEPVAEAPLEQVAEVAAEPVVESAETVSC